MRDAHPTVCGRPGASRLAQDVQGEKTMKKDIAVTVALVVCSLAVFSSCSSPASQLKKAEEQNTEQAYQEVIQNYPGTPEAGQAQTRLELVVLEMARKTKTEEALETFMRRFPSSSLRQTAEAELERMMSSRVENSGTVDAYRDYLRRFPFTPFAATATQRVTELEMKGDLEDLYGKLATFLNGDESKNVLAAVCGNKFVAWAKQEHAVSMMSPGAKGLAEYQSSTGRLRVMTVSGEIRGSMSVARVTDADFSPGCRLEFQAGRQYEFRSGHWTPVPATK
jgi:hypothetical protein